MISEKKILVAPLNWGLGHAARCIPIINALIKYNFTPILAGDGDSLTLLKKEFPELSFYRLPSYNIEYSSKGSLKLKLLLNSPYMLQTMLKEKQVVKNIHGKEKLSGIISDNRFGVYHPKLPSVYITHQIHVLSGNTTSVTSKIHQKIISKFNECWVPDNNSKKNLSGKLSQSNYKINTKYIGVLSRFNNVEAPIKYDLLVLLSGPEPQRTILENKLLKQLAHYKKKALFVRGVFTDEQLKIDSNSLTVVNHLLTNKLEEVINESEMVLARAGYSTIMDLAKLSKKAFFIPTPRQNEQEYLADRLKKLQIAPFANQDDFEIEMLTEVKNYNGFNNFKIKEISEELFNLFYSK